MRTSPPTPTLGPRGHFLLLPSVSFLAAPFCRPLLCHCCHRASPFHSPITISTAPAVASHWRRPCIPCGRPLCHPRCRHRPHPSNCLSPSMMPLLSPNVVAITATLALALTATLAAIFAHCIQPCCCLLLSPSLPHLLSPLLSPLLPTNYQSANQPANQPTNQPVYQHANQSATQPFNTDQPFSQPATIHQANQQAPGTLANGQSAKWPVTLPASSPTSQLPTSQSAHQTIGQPTGQ